jgi:diguanylate cyclase (GGDEF)-like protein
VKRVSISLDEFLQRVVLPLPLTGEDRAALRSIRETPGPDAKLGPARRLLESLLRRRLLIALERSDTEDGEVLLLRDPRSRARVRIRLPRTEHKAEIPGDRQAPELREAPDFRKIPLPLEPSSQTGLKHHEVQELLSIEGNLVSYERLLTPRELTLRLRRVLQELVPVSHAAFHAVEMPAEEAWPPVRWRELPAPKEELTALARDRDHLLVWNRTEEGASRLLIGLGDPGTGWRGLIELGHRQPGHFTPERLALIVLVTRHFANLLATVIRLQGLVFYDVLTGIPNRSYYEDQVEREIGLARRRTQAMALLIADIDDFKDFNTRFGYDGGDRVLATVACVLKSALRGTDTLARYGGEEFAIILAPPIPREEAYRIAERLRSAVEEEPFEITDLDGNRVRRQITISIGVALYPESGTTPRDLWSAANRLVLQAKADGKNQVCFPRRPD